MPVTRAANCSSRRSATKLAGAFLALTLFLIFYHVPAMAQPVVTVSPSSGPTSGGTIVTTTGALLFCPVLTCTGVRVLLDGVQLGGQFGDNGQGLYTVTFLTPPHAPGAVDVVVTQDGVVFGIAPLGFTYVAPATAAIPALDWFGKGALAVSMLGVALLVLRRVSG